MIASYGVVSVKFGILYLDYASEPSLAGFLLNYFSGLFVDIQDPVRSCFHRVIINYRIFCFFIVGFDRLVCKRIHLAVFRQFHGAGIPADIFIAVKGF